MTKKKRKKSGAMIGKLTPDGFVPKGVKIDSSAFEHARKKEEARRAKGRGKLSDEKLASLKPLDLSEVLQDRKGIGTFVLQTNRSDLNCQKVHLLNKTRQEIEQTFKSYDTVLDNSASYLQDLHAHEA
ncbi:MAG: transposase [Spirochaetia bacterium]|nr:transposase [Spirochaetia bacterium]